MRYPSSTTIHPNQVAPQSPHSPSARLFPMGQEAQSMPSKLLAHVPASFSFSRLARKLSQLTKYSGPGMYETLIMGYTTNLNWCRISAINSMLHTGSIVQNFSTFVFQLPSWCSSGAPCIRSTVENLQRICWGSKITLTDPSHLGFESKIQVQVAVLILKTVRNVEMFMFK